MATQITEKQGYFSGWTLKKEGIIAPDELVPWGQSIFLGLQHVLAMFGATVLAVTSKPWQPGPGATSTSTWGVLSWAMVLQPLWLVLAVAPV